MVNNCANPNCNKPLHYLRDGRVFVFDVASKQLGADGKRLRQLEHFWLCGDCEPTMIVEYNHDHGVTVLPRRTPAYTSAIRPTALAS